MVYGNNGSSPLSRKSVSFSFNIVFTVSRNDGSVKAHRSCFWSANQTSTQIYSAGSLSTTAMTYSTEAPASDAPATVHPYAAPVMHTTVLVLCSRTACSRTARSPPPWWHSQRNTNTSTVTNRTINSSYLYKSHQPLFTYVSVDSEILFHTNYPKRCFIKK